MNIKVNKEKVNTFLVILFIFMSSITIPIKKYTGSGSVVWLITFFSLFLSITINRRISKYYLYILFTILSLLFANILLVDYKVLVINEFIEIIKFAIIPLYLATNRINYQYFIKYWCWFCKLNFWILLFLLPDVISNDINYMVYGVSLAYSFTGFIYEYIFESKNKICSLTYSIASLILIFIFGNRSSLLICIIIYVILKIYNKKNIIKTSIFLLFISTIGIYIYGNLKKVLILLQYILSKFSIYSYSITKYIMALDKGLIESSSGREVKFIAAVDIIKSNPIKPHGIGYFTHVTGMIYPHNIFLDLWITFGIIGTILAVIYGIVLILRIKYISNKRFKALLVSIIVLEFIWLNFSGTFVEESLFWVIIGILTNVKRMEC